MVAPSRLMIRALWFSAVRTEIWSAEATSLADRPSANSWRTSRCRGVSSMPSSVVGRSRSRQTFHDFRDCRRHIRPPSQRFTNGCQQFGACRVFQHETRSAGAHGPDRVVGVFVHGQERRRGPCSPPDEVVSPRPVR